MWLYCRMLRVLCLEQITNVEIRYTMKKDREVVLNTVKARKYQLLSCIMRNENRHHILYILQVECPCRRKILWLTKHQNLFLYDYHGVIYSRCRPKQWSLKWPPTSRMDRNVMKKTLVFIPFLLSFKVQTSGKTV